MPVKRYIILLILLVFVASAPAQSQGRSGTVAATMDAEGYTYVQIDIAGEKIWFAAPAIELKIGDRVVAPAGMPMKDFHSKTLDRTFDMIYFVDAITLAGEPENQAVLPAGHPSIQSATCPAPTPACFDFSGIEMPEGAKTVADIHQDAATLAGQAVVVRGIAVKVSNGIMGKNWIHLQDGTGDIGSNDLTVTTTNTVEVGAAITASGTLATNLDFGYSYKYAVLLEDAAVKE
jgi:hypothetical protein